MSSKPFFIGPINSGLERDVKPFMLPNDAFPEVTDAYFFRGRIERRTGNEFLGILVQYAAITYAAALVAGNTTYTNTLANIPISPGSVTILVRDTGAGAPLYTFIDDGFGALGTTLSFNITGITKALNAVVTAPGHPFVGGETVFIFGVQGMTAINGGPYNVVGVAGDDITINVDSTLFATYTGHGKIGTAVGSINYTTGVFVLDFPALAAPVTQWNVIVSYEYFPFRPVMALPTEDTTSINRENLLAFDTVKANLYSNTLKRFQDISFDTAGTAISWTGTDSDFFWAWNYYVDALNNKLIWVTNNVPADRIRYFNGAFPVPGVSGGWTIFRPQLNPGATRFLDTALLIVSYRNRLVVLNTTEFEAAADVRHPQRARWSQNGTPLDAVNSWDDVTIGRGGYIDAPTSEEIISCGFFKDTLIVTFERSTWALVYTGNEILPFIWQQINSQFGAESTFSLIPFDRGIFGIGDKGIIVADTVNVERIDQKIPDVVFDIHNGKEGPQRVHGIRDYFFQFAYWTLGDSALNRKFPNRVLVLNYLEGAYSFYKDSYTCFGYFQSVDDRTWANTREPWATVEGTWASGRLQSDFPDIVAGNQQGFVMIMDRGNPNGKSLHITNITQDMKAVVTSPDHNLEVGQYIVFSEVEGMTEINGITGEVVKRVSDNVFWVDIDSTGFGAYTRSGYITVINNIEIVSKKFNPFYQQGNKCRMNYLDFYLDKTSHGQFEIDILGDDTGYTTSLPSLPIGGAIQTDTILTTQSYGPTYNVEKMWQRDYLNVSGQFLQFRIYLNDSDMRDRTIRDEDIVIHGINLWMMPAGDIFSYDRATL